MSQYLKESKNSARFDENEAKFVDFMQNQLDNRTKNCSRYNLATFEFSYMLSSKAPGAYECLRLQSMLRVPHLKHLQKMARGFNLRPNKKVENIEYLKKISKSMPEKSKIINISGDEVYLKAGLTMRNGHLRGFAANKPKKIANTCFVLYFNSIFSSFGQVYSILPVSGITAKDIDSYFDEAVETLQGIGFHVVSTSIDGNRINQKYYKDKMEKFGNTCWYPNPSKPGEKIFMFFDALHIFKNFRNNWLAKQNAKSPLPPKLHYPSWPGRFRQSKVANFDSIRKIFFKNITEFSDGQKVIQNSYKLSSKALWPSVFDKQKEKYVRQIFNERVVADLKVLGDFDTAEFVEICTNWEHLLNSRDLLSGVVSRIYQKEPYRGKDDPKLKDLQTYVDWFESWQSKDFNSTDNFTKKLSHDSFFCVLQTTKALIQFVEYIFTNFSPK